MVPDGPILLVLDLSRPTRRPERGIYGCDPRDVLDVLRAATHRRAEWTRRARMKPRGGALLLVLCRDPLEPARPDRAFSSEVAAIERLALPYVLIDHDSL